MNGLKPTHAKQLGNTAGIVPIRLDRDDRERRMNPPSCLHQNAVQATSLVTLHKKR